MGIPTVGDHVVALATTMRTGRDALDQLATTPELAREAFDVLGAAGGGVASVRALDEATTPGARLLRDAWHGADLARRELPQAAGRLDGDNRAAATMAAAHADAAADLLDTFVYGGGVHFDAATLSSMVGRQLDLGVAQAERVSVPQPRVLRAWEAAWQEGRRAPTLSQ